MWGRGMLARAPPASLFLVHDARPSVVRSLPSAVSGFSRSAVAPVAAVTGRGPSFCPAASPAALHRWPCGRPCRVPRRTARPAVSVLTWGLLRSSSTASLTASVRNVPPWLNCDYGSVDPASVTVSMGPLWGTPGSLVRMTIDKPPQIPYSCHGDTPDGKCDF